MEKISEEQLKKSRHPNELSRFRLALVISFLTLALVITSIIISGGIVFIGIGIIFFSIWFFFNVLKANLIGNSIKVTNDNFPEIHKIKLEVKEALSYDKKVDMYVVQNGAVNAFIAKFLKTKFIILNSKLIEGLDDKSNLNQVRWVIGRFVGSLKAKHFQLDLFRVLIESVESIKILNFFLLPYFRATQYTGDNIGFLLAGNLKDSITAFDRFMLGNGLAEKVEFKGVLRQSLELENSFFAFYARLFSQYPHLVDRYVNMIDFVRWHDKKEFNTFISGMDPVTVAKLDILLPNLYGKNKEV